MQNAKRALEVVSYFLLITLSCILIYQQLFAKQTTAPDTIQTGDVHASLKMLAEGVDDQTLVLALSPSCPYCEKSMAFYKELLAARGLGMKKIPIMAAVHEKVPVAEEEKILRSYGVVVDRIVQLDFKALKIQGVPAMLLIDRKGKVLEVWKGYQDEIQQNAIIEML